MSGLIEKIEHAMHHGKKDKEEVKADETPKFGSGHIVKASGGYYDAGADLNSQPVHIPNAKEGASTHMGDEEDKKNKHTSGDETGAGRSDDHLRSGDSGAVGGPATASNKEKETTSSSRSEGQGYDSSSTTQYPSSIGTTATSQPQYASSTTTTYSGYEVGSTQPVGQVLPGPANIAEIREEVEEASYGGVTGTSGGYSSGTTGRSTDL